MATTRRQIDVWYDKDGDRVLDSVGRAAVTPYIYYGEQALMLLRVVKSDLTAYTGFSATDVPAAAIDQTPGGTGAPMVETLTAGINVAGDWALVDPANGLFSIRLDAYTTPFQTAISTLKTLPVTFRLQALPAGESYISAVVQFAMEARGRISLGAGSPAVPLSDYYTKIQADALLAGKVDKVGTADIEITDTTKGIIMAIGATRYRCTLELDGATPVWKLLAL
jgi:hypothetical protein